MTPPRIHSFPNGCRLVHETPPSDVPITAIQVFVDYGSVYETDTDRGTAHFIEHMVFKGTKKIPRSDQLFRSFDQVGAYINAYTVKRYTCYEIKCNDSVAEPCIRVLVDMLLNSTFDSQEVRREEHVVVEENLQSVDDDDDILDVYKDRILYANTPYAFPVDDVAFHPPKVPGYDVVRIRRIYRTYYQPARMVVSIVSNRSCAYWITTLSKTDLVRRARAVDEVPRYLSTPLTGGAIHRIPTKGEVVRLVLAFRIGNLHDPDRYALNLLKYVVGGHFSSRMFLILREQHGLTYTSDAITDHNEYLGEFTLYAEMDRTKLLSSATSPGVYPLLLDLCADLRRRGVTPQELSDTKNYLKGTRMLKGESNAVHARHNGVQTLLSANESSVSSYSSLFQDHYAHLSPMDLQRVIDRYLHPHNLTVIVAGSGLPSAKRLREVLTRHFLGTTYTPLKIGRTET